MDENLGVLCIVVFVVYPFALWGLLSWISPRVHDRRYRNLLAKVFTGIGLILATLLALAVPEAKVPYVCIIAAILVIVSCAYTGASLGALLDWQRQRGVRNP